MRILAHPSNNDQDFGKAVFHVEDFTDWLQAKRLRICTDPDLSGFDFVQVASLLQAIEKAARSISWEEAQDIVKADPFLAPMAMDGADPLHLVSMEAHRKWREVIRRAVSSRELILLDYVSKLPLVPLSDPKEDRCGIWKTKAQAMAVSIYQATPGKKEAIAREIAIAFASSGIRSSTGKPLTADNIARQALTPWTAPKMARENRKRV